MPILLLVGVNSSNFFSRAFAFKTTSPLLWRKTTA